MGAKVVAVLEFELLLTGLLDRHRQHRPLDFRPPGDASPELLVHKDAADVSRRSLGQRAGMYASKMISLTLMMPSRTSGGTGSEAPNRSFSNEPR